jgi:uncharacterized protein (DUF2062 family)
MSLSVINAMIPDKTAPTIWKRKIIDPLHNFLRLGLSSEKLALSIALGITLGTFPVLGMTTFLCMLAAFTLRLNLPVIQFANYFVYPLQILLLVPYYRIGGMVFSTRQNIDFDKLSHVLTGSTYKEVITMLFESTLNAIGAWLLISPLVLLMLYASLKPVLVRLTSRSSRIKFIRR